MMAGSSYRMTERCRAHSYRRWHRLRSKVQIMRSQLGFNHAPASYPTTCKGCQHYHGTAYGTQERVQLVCAFHPYGWLESTTCPDWYG